jgi:hypothetical protein
VSALEHILLGHRELFKGLWIDGSDYDWAPYQVIKLSMGNIKSSSPEEMEASLIECLSNIAQHEGVDISGAPDCLQALGDLICELYLKNDEKKWSFSSTIMMPR